MNGLVQGIKVCSDTVFRLFVCMFCKIYMDIFLDISAENSLLKFYAKSEAVGLYAGQDRRRLYIWSINP